MHPKMSTKWEFKYKNADCYYSVAAALTTTITITTREIKFMEPLPLPILRGRLRPALRPSCLWCQHHYKYYCNYHYYYYK